MIIQDRAIILLHHVKVAEWQGMGKEQPETVNMEVQEQVAELKTENRRVQEQHVTVILQVIQHQKEIHVLHTTGEIIQE